MGKRLVSLLTALALAVSAFASLAVAPAGAAVEQPASGIYFPWVPNGEEYGNMGPWYGSITVMNIGGATINLVIQRANGTTITTASLQPWASKSWSSTDLFQDMAGGGVIVQVQPLTLTATRGTTPDTSDTVSLGTSNCQVTSVSVTQGATTFSSPADYTWSQSGSSVVINWAPGGNEPAPGSTYTVSVTCNGLVAGVAKIAAPKGLEGEVWTSSDHESVTGYTALPIGDVNNPPRSWSFPIVQTNNGWDSVFHLTNFSSGNCSVNVDLYQTVNRVGSAGSSGPSEGHFSRLLSSGETWHIDLVHDYNWPAEWVGTAFVTADCWIGASVDRLKATQPWGTPVNMAITNVAQPTEGDWTEVYAPLVYQAYNGWNTGVAVANLDASNNNQVEIQFLNKDGIVFHSESLTIPPRAQEFVYLPANTDVGTNSLAQAIIRSKNGLNLAAAVDSVKYTGNDQDVGQATSYLAQQGTRAALFNGTNGTLSVALFQKELGLTNQRDNSGIALFNANLSGPAQVAATFRDGSGFLVAPSLNSPVIVDLPAGGGAVLYAPWYGEMPAGFRGSVRIEVVQGQDVSCVSNNVNYDVKFDGTATYNCFVTAAVDGQAPSYALTLDPVSAVNTPGQNGFGQHTITATLTFGGQPAPGIRILADITSGPNNATTLTVNPPVTNVSGQVTVSYSSNQLAGIDTIRICADLNNTQAIDQGDLCVNATKEWRPTGTLTLGLTQVLVTDVGDTTSDVTGNTVSITPAISGNDWVLQIIDGTANASFAPCGQPDANVGPLNTAADIYVCNGVVDSSFQVQLVADYNSNGQVDPGEPVIAGPITVTVA